MESNDNSAFTAETRPKYLGGNVIGWGLASLVFSITYILISASPSVLGASVMAKIFAVIASTVLALAGALIGDAIRRFARPDAIFTSGGIGSLIWNKVFWMIGPQVVGLFIGAAVGIQFVLG